LSVMAAALQNFSGRNTNSFRVFALEALYRRRGDVRGHQGPTPCGGVARGGPAPPGGVATSWPSSVSTLDSASCRGK
jgi:hypothetical protein